ncbi:MAG: DUF4410 domain-containing protein [Methylococcales bacterium]|nr:DUF4410 domain-containing protein [Methylococcaceae bacterium]
MNTEKIQKRLLVIALFSMITMLYGCASAKINVLKPLASQPSTASLSLLDKTGKQISEEDFGNLKAALSTSLQESGTTLVSTEKKNVATIVGEIQEYDKGSRPLRYFIGFGAGTGHMKSAWKIIDQAGAEAASCNIDGSISAGVFGGSFYDVHDEVAKAFITFFTGTK